MIDWNWNRLESVDLYNFKVGPIYLVNLHNFIDYNGEETYEDLTKLIINKNIKKLERRLYFYEHNHHMGKSKFFLDITIFHNKYKKISNKSIKNNIIHFSLTRKGPCTRYKRKLPIDNNKLINILINKLLTMDKPLYMDKDYYAFVYLTIFWTKLLNKNI